MSYNHLQYDSAEEVAEVLNSIEFDHDSDLLSALHSALINALQRIHELEQNIKKLQVKE